MANITLDEIDGITYGWDCERYVKEAPTFFEEQRKKQSYNDEYSLLQEELIINSYHPTKIERGQ